MENLIETERVSVGLSLLCFPEAEYSEKFGSVSSMDKLFKNILLSDDA